MFGINSFGIVGGDKRQLYCAKSIADDGFNTVVTGFDTDKAMGLKICGLEECTAHSDAFILPLPVTDKNGNITTQLFSGIIAADRKTAALFEDKPIFCGMSSRLRQCEGFEHLRIYDYGIREEFAVNNAVPTAEGALEIAMREYEGTICHAHCLVAGYGRIGKILSKMLLGLGADVTVSARKLSDLAYIEASGMKAIETEHLSGHFDVIFNTVPSLIFDAHILAKAASKAIVIDLASYPGGVDFDAAKRMNIRTFWALSLPGKSAPMTAGKIIKNAVYNIAREERL